MTRSSNKDLIQPFENPERVFRSSRKLSKTQSLDYLNSLEFYLISDLEDQFEEEETKSMAETMENNVQERFKELLMKCPQHYLTDMQEHNETSRTRNTETSDGLDAIQAQLNNLGREIKKVNEKVYAAQVGCKLCNGPRPLKEEGKTLKEAYYTQFGVPFQQGGQYIAVALGFYQRNNANPSYQERRQSMEESPSKFMNESAKRHEENSNLIKEIRDSTDAAIKNQGASIKALEIQIGQMSMVLKERGSVILPSSTKTNMRDHVNSISTTVETDTIPIRRIGSTRYAVSAQLNSKLILEPRRATIPFPSRLYDDCYDEEKGS
ncbi:hypothetical protein Tco_1030448 [Tanacetum coccineum]|uniref:Uncharacterized protein n=1 Tax=Tanacetum coccineum TaxID=301880 RepID=A0ABQ5G690_9ASTR